MKKCFAVLVLVSVIIMVAAGCGTKETGETSSADAAPIQLPSSTSQLSTPASESEQSGLESSDAVTSASVKEGSDPDALLHAMTEDGYWIFSLLDDVTLTEELAVNGTFYDKDDTSSVIFRKLSLYAQDSNRVVTEEYTLTVPRINVSSPGFRIQCGVVKGDIYVDAEGFELYDTTLEGDLIFATQERMDTANLERATVTGDIYIS